MLCAKKNSFYNGISDIILRNYSSMRYCELSLYLNPVGKRDSETTLKRISVFDESKKRESAKTNPNEKQEQEEE